MTTYICRPEYAKDVIYTYIMRFALKKLNALPYYMFLFCGLFKIILLTQTLTNRKLELIVAEECTGRI
jgi:hypothetical protein